MSESNLPLNIKPAGDSVVMDFRKIVQKPLLSLQLTFHISLRYFSLGVGPF